MNTPSLRVGRLLVCGVAACLAAPVIAPAQERAQRGSNKTDGYRLVSYEVGDLVVDVPDYMMSSREAKPSPSSGMGGGYGGGMGGMGGGAMGGGSFGGEFGARAPQSSPSREPDSKVTLSRLRSIIPRVVEPESWSDTGGGGEIQEVGHALVVWQTAAVHEQIRNFLQGLREGSAGRKTVAIDARWLMLNSDEVDGLIRETDEGQFQLDRKTLAELTRRPSSIRAMTKCFSGQAVYLISGTRKNVVSTYIPVVGSVESRSKNAYASAGHRGRVVFVQQRGGGMSEMGGYGSSGRDVGYQPVVVTPNFGVLLEIRPTLMLDTDKRTAVVDVRSTITFPGDLKNQNPVTVPMDGGFGGMGMEMGMGRSDLAPQVDRLAIQTQELATTLRVSLGEPVLVGGMTHVSPGIDASPETAAPEAEQPQLYLVLEVR